MKTYLYIFGYEDPFDLKSNQTTGSDFESSRGVWIQAETENEAILVGQAYAREYVASEFKDSEIEYTGWNPECYANWIEESPTARYSQSDLNELPRITA